MEHDMPFERASSNQFHWEKGVYPQPSLVLFASLQKIEPDGSVIADIQGENGIAEKVICHPWNPLHLEKLSKDTRARHLYDIARAIQIRCREIAHDPEVANETITTLAIYLTAYRHEPDFLQKATSLVNLTETGWVRGF